MLARTSLIVLVLAACGGDPTDSPADATIPEDATTVDSVELDSAPATDSAPASDSAPATDTTIADTTVVDTVVDVPDTSAPTAVMKIHMLDVGQGDAFIVELPCGAMLVDTGGEYTEGVYDSDIDFEAQVRAFFASRPDLGATFDLVVLTHPHIDHTRGVGVLLAMVASHELTIEHVLTNGDESGFDSGIDEQRALHDFADEDPNVDRWYVLQRKTGATGETNDIIDPFPMCQGFDPIVTALWGRIDNDSPLSDTWDPNDLSNANNHSVVLRIQLGDASVLMPGDLEEAGIAALMAQYAGTNLLDVTLYKVGHHGSYNGTTPAFVNAMSPKVALVSAGPSDRQGEFTAWAFGHPRWRAISDLVGDSDSDGVALARPPIDAPVATSYEDGHGVFETRHITRAVYCTGWEKHDVVITLRSDGVVL